MPDSSDGERDDLQGLPCAITIIQATNDSKTSEMAFFIAIPTRFVEYQPSTTTTANFFLREFTYCRDWDLVCFVNNDQ